MYCCNLSVGVVLNCDSPRTGCARSITRMYKWHEQATKEWYQRVISIVACCHSANLCAHAARAFQSQQNGALTRIWRLCQVQPSHKERAIGAVHCKKEGMLLQPLRWHCVECVIHHQREVHEEQQFCFVMSCFLHGFLLHILHCHFSSVARWLSLKPAKRCHEKPDPAKNMSPIFS